MKKKFWKEYINPICGLAPMHNVTTDLFRELYCRTCKPDVVFTEFISAEGLARVPEKFANTVRYSGIQRPIVAQLFGSEIQSFPKSILYLINLGYDGIDINMGCPASGVIRTGGGGALISNFKLTDKIICRSLAITQKYNIPLSIKTRIIKNDDENNNWFSFLSSYPLDSIIIHGRYLSQKNNGVVDWNKVGMSAIYFRNNITMVLGNGGISDCQSCNSICKKYCLDGCLIGQGAIGNPLVFSDGNILDLNYKFQILQQIINIIRTYYHFYKLIDLKHFIFLSIKNWGNTSIFKKNLIQAKNVKEIIYLTKKLLLSLTSLAVASRQ